jgi:hypothetical protein
MLKWGFFGVFKKRERQPSVFLRRSLKFFLWFCFVFVRVLFAKMACLCGVFEQWKIKKAWLRLKLLVFKGSLFDDSQFLFFLC